MKGLLLFWLLVPILGWGQKLENLNASSQGDKIIISYDLSSAQPTDKFIISIYSSHNNFSSPLQYVNGDVGQDVTPGKGKQIQWAAKNELINYKGDLSFEVRAELMVPFGFFPPVSSAKRGKMMPVLWRGGSKDQEVRIELIKDNTLQSVIATTSNNGKYEWPIPSSQKPGADYKIRLVNGRETITSDAFAIKHKVPTLLKVLPVVAIGVVVVLSGGSSKTNTPTRDPILATPPDLGLN